MYIENIALVNCHTDV